MSETPPSREELEQVSEDLTAANAKLKRQAELDRDEIARLTFRNSELENTNQDLMGEHGLDTARKLVSMLQEQRLRNTALSEAMRKIVEAVPREFWAGIQEDEIEY